ncbi:MAG: hypothetical protein M1832_002812 [Thelocarpon impressellum]|nr:MAG: hypothetical protein M1832_002812 [Thelocarpon impressellum]
MASPPNIAMSPTYAGPSVPSKKRPPGPAVNTKPSKRRRPSTVSNLSAGAHPLRQTSFPPDQGAGAAKRARSPSAEGSVATGSGRRGKKGRSKAPSTAGGSVRGAKAPASATSLVVGNSGGAAGGEAEDEDEDEGDAEAALMMEDEGKANDDQERQKLEILVGAFNTEQADRYSYFRRAKLHPPTVRKITNQTLSQSVPEVVVKTVNGFTKVFIGEMIERAREVQTQWMAAESATGEADEHARGPLLPDHLREALRRYKKDKEGGGAGLRGLSLAAMNGFPTATGGKRLFR